MIRELTLFRLFFSLRLLPSFSPFCTEEKIYAIAIYAYLDQRACYSTDRTIVWEKKRFSLESLLRRRFDAASTVKSLNTNQEETGIWIIPNLGASTAQKIYDDATRPCSLAAKAALYGLNSSESHFIYYTNNRFTTDVTSILLPQVEEEDENGWMPELNVAFAPMSDDGHLLQTENRQFCSNGSSRNGVWVYGLSKEEELCRRFEQDWMTACRNRADIFFAPEMLAVPRMVEICDGVNPFLEKLVFQAAKQEMRPPRITVMPTWWDSGVNKVLVFDEYAKLLGSQNKRYRYIDESHRQAEALTEESMHDGVLLIHLEKQQRVAIVICAEFLYGARGYVQDFLCRQLGVTLLLVPAFSHGEEDFINRLPSLRPYGTTVIWGNCCGAAKVTPQVRQIGGACSYAGMDGVSRFPKSCGFHCEPGQSCCFLVRVPSQIVLQKPDSPCPPEIIQCCEKI